MKKIGFMIIPILVVYLSIVYLPQILAKRKAKASV